MAEGRVVLDLVLAVTAAFVGGLLAERLRLPVVLGYLLAGVALGPFTPGLTIGQGSVQLLAEIGVAFLMFALGTEFSRAELRRLGLVGGIGGTVQIVGTIALGIPLGMALLGATALQGVYLGAMLALSSTVVALKVLMGRGETQTPHGRAALGLLVAQDLAVVPMVIVLPSLTAGGGVQLARLGAVALEAVGILLGSYVIGARVAPWVLARVAIPRTRELFLLGVVTLALGTAVLTQAIGLSFAFGAFLAGLVMAESDFRTRAAAEALPFRDLFTSLFFVSVGMLIDPRIFLRQPGLIALLALAVIVGKAVIATAGMLLLRMPGRTAVLGALTVAQIGEFSFVLARVGVDNGSIPESFFEAVLATSLITITISPFLVSAGPSMLGALARLPRAGARFAPPALPPPELPRLRGHVVVCGYGRVGRELVDALRQRRVPCLVIEHNPQLVEGVQDLEGVDVIYGDAANPAVLQHAHLDSAIMAAVLIPGAGDVELTVGHIRQLNPGLDVIARAGGRDSLGRLEAAGAGDVVQPEFEAGVEVIRHALRRVGVGGEELDGIVERRREEYYRRGASADQDE